MTNLTDPLVIATILWPITALISLAIIIHNQRKGNNK